MPSVTCSQCPFTSYNPHNIRDGYCGNCHDWTGVPAGAITPGMQAVIDIEERLLYPAWYDRLRFTPVRYPGVGFVVIGSESGVCIRIYAASGESSARCQRTAARFHRILANAGYQVEHRQLDLLVTGKGEKRYA
jgi:hypothetical protein